MAEARKQIRLCDNPSLDGQRAFHPTLETMRDSLAPVTDSKLRLADELDTYLERVQVRSV